MIVVGVVFEHADKVNKKLPDLVQLPKQDGHHLGGVGDDLVQEGAEERTVDIGDQLFKGFSRIVLRVFRNYELPQG